jgi:hypothetical protein
MDIRPAKFIRDVDPNESVDEVINEAKAFTWTHHCEHALLRLELGRLVLVRGGADGIEFKEKPDGVYVTIDEIDCRVTGLAWHTHPRPTGPSDHDRAFLEKLPQGSSMIYELFGDHEGTRFSPRGKA